MSYKELEAKIRGFKIPKDKVQHFIISTTLTVILGFGTAISIMYLKAWRVNMSTSKIS